VATPEDDPARRAVETVWRMESARLIAGLARIVRDVGTAEELAQDALIAALEQWPVDGVPDRPGAWLMAVGRRRAVDLIRRRETLHRKVEQLGHELGTAPDTSQAELEAVVDDAIEDDLLRLIFVACHPALSTEARVALTLRMLGGLSTDEIARAFLIPETTVAQRIVRAKKSLAQLRVPFAVPPPAERAERLTSVLDVLYLIFNEGYSATAGDDWVRPELCSEALRLGRVLAGLMPAEAEVHGLVALLQIQASRLRARTGPGGAPVLLMDQDRSRWDRILIGRGLMALDEALELAPSPGPYALQAAIAACHARARRAEDTDWVGIATLYGDLVDLTRSPVAELNRAVAVSMAYGPAEALPIVDALLAVPALAGYHLLPSVRGDLLARLGRPDEARAELERAAGLTRNGAERTLLLDRAAELGRNGDR
jgi:RNA polymerase sigma factor (sigma-70 family)